MKSRGVCPSIWFGHVLSDREIVETYIFPLFLSLIHINYSSIFSDNQDRKCRIIGRQLRSVSDVRASRGKKRLSSLVQVVRFDITVHDAKKQVDHLRCMLVTGFV